MNYFSRFNCELIGSLAFFIFMYKVRLSIHKKRGWEGPFRTRKCSGSF